MEKKSYATMQRLKAMNPAEMVLRGYRCARESVTRRAIIMLKYYFSEENFLKRNHLSRTCDLAGKSFFHAFRIRKMFPWQELSGKELSVFFQRNFKANKKETLTVAGRLLSKKFIVLDHEINFDHEIDWHLDFLAGKSVPLQYWNKIDYRNPDTIREVRYLWELNRHQHFVTLAKAFSISGDEKYAQELFSQWQHWLEKNPYKFGINWASSLEMSLRLIAWVWALYIARNSAHLTNDLYIKILHSVEQHASHIEKHLSYFSSANNHLIGESLGLFYAGIYFPELRRAKVWRNKGYYIFQRQIFKQVFSDGVGREQAVHYQLYNLYYCFLFRLACRAERIVFPKMVNRLLGKMANFISCLVDHGGHIVHVGDDDGGTALCLNELAGASWLDLLNIAAIELHDGHFKTYCREFSETAFWLCGIKGLKSFMDMFAAPEKAAVIKFPQGGYVIMRCYEKPNSHLVFDCGPLGLGALAAHGHADALSFSLNIKNEPVLIDCGTFMYLGAGEERNYFRGTQAHNTVCIDSRDQSEIIGPFHWGHRANAKLIEIEDNPDQITVRARHDGYQKRGVIHERSLLFEKPARWIVIDSLQGKGWHAVKIFFHTLSLDYRILQEDQVRFRFKNFSLLFTSAVKSHSKFSLTVNPMAHSVSFGKKELHPAMILSVSGVMPMEITTKIEIIT